jgi:hypothetical protein
MKYIGKMAETESLLSTCCAYLSSWTSMVSSLQTIHITISFLYVNTKTTEPGKSAVMCKLDGIHFVSFYDFSIGFWTCF